MYLIISPEVFQKKKKAEYNAQARTKGLKELGKEREWENIQKELGI